MLRRSVGVRSSANPSSSPGKSGCRNYTSQGYPRASAGIYQWSSIKLKDSAGRAPDILFYRVVVYLDSLLAVIFNNHYTVFPMTIYCLREWYEELGRRQSLLNARKVVSYFSRVVYYFFWSSISLALAKTPCMHFLRQSVLIGNTVITNICTNTHTRKAPWTRHPRDYISCRTYKASCWWFGVPSRILIPRLFLLLCRRQHTLWCTIYVWECIDGLSK